MSIYLDNAATTPLAPELIELLNELNTNLYANPSSLHSAGRTAKKQLNQARKTIAAILKAEPEEIIFTSGATEANNYVFQICDYDLIITSPAEHASVLEPAKSSGKNIIWLTLNKEGYINLEELKSKLEENSQRKIMLSLMHGNNEIGTIHDIETIATLKAQYPNVIFHSDCVQSFAKYDIDLSKTPIDLISASAHKIHGPKGVGLLYIRKQIQTDQALIIGGGQEFSLRSGTENLNGIIAFAKAAQLSQEQDSKLEELHNYLFKQLKQIDGLIINGPQEVQRRLIGNMNISLSKLKLNSEELVLQMDLKGIAISSGSACSSNKASASIESSYVLRACQITDDLATKAIRISVSRFNNKAELDQLCDIIRKLSSQFS
ncbi:MAG: cysteine desulfurase family protein [Cyanobacteria bacterium]|nr:cysteine desulfurase family protein [Cyanobacteriota bacterium]MDA1020439.1 cysteine desulfurase family protein [Cyanobacteriota bacterium]